MLFITVEFEENCETGHKKEILLLNCFAAGSGTWIEEIHYQYNESQTYHFCSRLQNDQTY